MLEEFKILELKNNKINSSLTQLQEQQKLLKNSYDILQKKTADDYEKLLYKCKGKDDVIEELKLALEMN